ncbi:MAG: hypothetical protein LC623_04530 [Halobacteriales archaeon]|nr:hypothetical protein [Halobacteriales archaeon]
MKDGLQSLQEHVSVDMTEPFYRRIWFWTLVAPVILLVIVVFASLFLRVWNDTTYTVTFSRVTGTPDGPVYNMTGEEAAHLPGDLARVLTRASQTGTASASFSSLGDDEEVRQAMHDRKYVRFYGTIVQVESIMVSN